jgi:hypothetical protein
MKANEKKYHQAEGISQLTKGQLLKDIGPLGIGPKVINILQGTYVPSLGTSSTTKAFLKEMKTSAAYMVCPPITLQTFKEGWRKMKE